MFTKLQCLSERANDPEGQQWERKGYRVKTNSIANWIFIECWRRRLLKQKHKKEESQKIKEEFSPLGTRHPTVACSRFVFCNFCFSVSTFFFCCFDIFVIFFILFAELPMLIWKLCCSCCRSCCCCRCCCCCPLSGLSPKVNSRKFNFPRQTKVWETFFLCHFMLLFLHPPFCIFYIWVKWRISHGWKI